MILVPSFAEGPHLHAAILHGEPRRVKPVPYGQISYFADDALVLYQLITKRVQTFLIRGVGSVNVPGVSPAVNLLSHAINATQSRRLVASVNWLTTHEHFPEMIDDALWLRLTALLNKEKYGVRDLRSILSR